ncbi:hypothetical protein [Stappia indica]|uniref:hypothetical protein n=1 Tax=Stappia indica TaxID=538381 RepID=UPI001CD42892|nr:hypothetical protein [Stappia indica]MCA1298012.1 hypothetical protein [Stappia indica]
MSLAIGKDPDYLKRALRETGPVPSVEVIIDISEEIREPLAALIDGLPINGISADFIRQYASLSKDEQSAVIGMIAALAKAGDKRKD